MGLLVRRPMLAKVRVLGLLDHDLLARELMWSSASSPPTFLTTCPRVSRRIRGVLRTQLDCLDHRPATHPQKSAARLRRRHRVHSARARTGHDHPTDTPRPSFLRVGPYR